jgi:hypothetical protein
MLAITIVEGVALVLLGLLVVGLLRSHAEILRALADLGAGIGPDGPDRQTSIQLAADGGSAGEGVGGPAHDLQGETLDGETVAIGVVGASQDTVLAFLSAGCYTCEPFWKALSGSVEIPNNARIIALAQAADNISKLRTLAGPELLVLVSDSAWTDYQVPGSPHFVGVNGASGTIAGEGTASNWPQIRDLLEHATRGARSARDGAIAVDPRDNAERIDRELQAAGIGPGHASLYPELDNPANGSSRVADHR